MNGAGTQENPYIIMNADDLYSMGTLGGSQVYFSINKDIDLNNTQYSEKFVPITLNCKKLIGNGHVIRNVNYSRLNENVSMFSVAGDDENNDITIEGLRIENIKLAGKNSFIFGNSSEGKISISLDKCVFIMNEMSFIASEPCSENDRRCVIHDKNITVSADYCTFVSDVYFHRIQPLFSGDTLSHCQLKFLISTYNLVSTSDKYNAPMSGVTISDSYFFVKINRRISSSIESMAFSSSDCTFSGCYMVCEVIAGVSSVLWNGKVGNICFFDKEVISKNVKSSSMRNDTTGYSYKVVGLTTEQCKDAVYLRSIGFNCMGADE
ncbi:MAG: hypothetical protein K2L10_11170 [Ruminococcus sp.]|nr:hypothetical protein [Ruminococcus sp.]